MKQLLIFLSGLAILVGCNEVDEKVILPDDYVFAKDTLTFIFAGDIMCHYPQVASAKTMDDYDFTPWFQHVKPIVAQADLAFVNLETTLSATGPFRGYPRFKSPDHLGYALADTGFDVVVTANNHSNDTKKVGLEHTIDVLNSLGLHHTGTFKNPLHRKLQYPLIINDLGLKIGLLNYTYDTNGIPDQPPTHVNIIDTIQIKKDINLALQKNPDLLLAFMHWGYEYHPKPNSNQKRIAQMMIREGVDHIIGAHPHVVQPIEIESRGQQKHLVAYSLGNFVSNQNKRLTDGGIMVKMRLVKEESKITLLDWDYIPVWRYIRPLEVGKQYEIIPTRSFLQNPDFFHGKGAHREMVKFHEYLNQHLSP